MKSKLSFIILVILTATLVVIVRANYTHAQAQIQPSETPNISVVEPTAPPEEFRISVEATPNPTATPVAPATAPEAASDLPDIDLDSWEYVLVNTENLLTEDFIPELANIENSQQFDSRAADYLMEMIEDARAEGLSVYVASTYRPYTTQKYLFDVKVSEYGGDEEKAATIVARPGSSEHQTGLAVDLTDKYYEYMNESIADTELAIWLEENCQNYGFILRFPEDKQDITGIMFEPWHFRYVGVEAATYIMENGLCYEEFVELYN